MSHMVLPLLQGKSNIYKIVTNGNTTGFNLLGRGVKYEMTFTNVKYVEGQDGQNT